NDGLSHTMKFTGTTTGSGDPNFSNIFVDFINLGTGTYPAGVTPVASVCEDHCGDGAPNSGEQCDDGNTDDGDGCSAVCTVEDGWECTDAQPGQPIDALQDPGFEITGLTDGTPNPFWAETSDIDLGGGQFFYPIC